ncbi:MAG: T9SS type A sorting domain-containing protein [Bacteroidetes bacterium]|nr:T9SS type A sorting domain-containing protein [Bacteroidota bacterium]
MGANRQVSCVTVDPADETVIWLGCSDSENNSGAAVTPILLRVIRANGPTSGPPGNQPSATAFAGPALPAGAYISNIDIESGNSNHLILTVSNYGVTSVWESTNGGTSWTSVEGNLPDMPIRWAKFIPNGYSARGQAIGGVMLATEIGVWTTLTLNGGSTVWIANNTGLANVRIDQLVLRTSDNVVGAATHGRGIFTATLLTPVPVELVEFTGLQRTSEILLKWTTASEFNSSHFELEKSENGVDYSRIASIPAAGISNDLRYYSYPDKAIKAERNYYRLRSVDLKGREDLSNVVLVKMQGISQKVYILGNPFNQVIDLKLFRAPVSSTQLRLLDLTGKLVAQKQFGKDIQAINWDMRPYGLSTGIYYLEVTVDGTKFAFKLIRQ